MRLLPSEPDIATLVARIRQGDLDLQPDFQRNEVWGPTKRKRLIDSILRDWYVPPIHVVQLENGKQQVLDGQQRLSAIRDFVLGKLQVDGNIEPANQLIQALNGLSYAELPAEIRRRVDQFTVRVFRLTDYEPSEPGELFFRLNQPANLTAAEQRNAYYGPAREQVRELVLSCGTSGLDKSFLGFSNARMALDDVVARTAMALERGTLGQRITAADLANRFRTPQPFTPQAVHDCSESIRALGHARAYVGLPVRFNKATLFSWLVFIAARMRAVAEPWDPERLAGFLVNFERLRRYGDARSETAHLFSSMRLSPVFTKELLAAYEDRASSRVADVLSVVVRDIAIWTMYWSVGEPMGVDAATQQLTRIDSELRRSAEAHRDAERYLTDIATSGSWGSLR